MMSQVAAAPEHAPLDWIILKISQVCNLNCSYCYVYNRGDDSWKSRPKFIGTDIIEVLANRIKEHCQENQLNHFVVELHGGEPLLLGKKRFDALVRRIREICLPLNITFIMQTNGLLLDSEWLDILDEHQVSFGISIDGPPAFHDANRVFRNGSGSSEKLLSVIKKLRQQHPAFERLFGGVLCVVNPNMHGSDTVNWFVENGFTYFEFLLPDATYINYPQNWTGTEPYKKFLIDAFNTWYAMGRNAPTIRMFETMIEGFLGRRPTLDALGGDIRKLCVVESDGGIGVSDVLRICSAYAYDTLNIRDHPLDAHASHYNLVKIQQPCETCQTCPFFNSCGGGYLPHRYDGASFDHPSLYCDALFGLLKTIHDQLRKDIPEKCWESYPVAQHKRLAYNFN